MNVEIGAETALFPEKDYINGIAVAVWFAIDQYIVICSATILYETTKQQYTSSKVENTRKNIKK